MRQVPIKLGPLALLLTVISICLTVLAILTFSTAQADVRLAEKYAETVSTRYALERQGQEYLAEVSQAISDGSIRDWLDIERDRDGVIWRSFEQDGARLRIGLVQEGNGCRVVTWRQEKEWNQNPLIGNLWAGF